MEPSNSVINPSGLPMRLERFKTVCLERRKLKGNLNKLIQRREALAVHELECAESELRRITAQAKDIRAQMEETRLAEVGGRPNSEGAMSYASTGPFDAATLFKLFKTADLEGDGPLPPDTLVTKGSPRNSPSFKPAESPIVLPTSDGGSPPGTPVHSPFPFKLDPRSEDCTPTIPIAGVDGQSYDRLLKLEARRYAELCEERRALEMEIEGRLADEEKAASMRVESAHSSLQAVRETIAEIRAGLKRASAGDTTANPGDTMETPGDTMENAGDTMENPGDTMENPGDTVENARDTMMNILPAVSNDVPHGGDGLEDTHTTASTIHPYSSEARVNASPSISDASTHNKSRPSLHVPESSRESHFARRALQSPEEPLATGSQITSTYKTRKKLTKKGHKQIERPRVVSHDSATPWAPKSIFASVGGE